MSAELRLRGRRVGWLDYYEEDVICRLEFDPKWVNSNDREVLAQQFEDRIPQPIDSAGLHQWFQELLPQGPLARFLAKQHSLELVDEYELLLALGGDLPGALEVIAAPGRVPPGRKPRPTQTPPPRNALAPAFSLSGALWKFSARLDERGLVIPVRGEIGDWIAKLDDPQYRDLPKVEYATILWARAAGISTPEVRLTTSDTFVSLPDGVPIGDGTVFLTQRFDRVPQPTHMEDFAQVLGRANQYRGQAEEIGAVLHALCPEDLEAYVRQLVFNIFAGNGDAHLKNWSIVYPDGRQARLSPAYDLVPTILFLPNQRLILPIGHEAAFAALTPEHFVPLARACRRDVNEVKAWVTDAAAAIAASWHNSRASFTPEAIEVLERHMASLALTT
jgi:serine/threonine-protein kinase HipA